MSSSVAMSGALSKQFMQGLCAADILSAVFLLVERKINFMIKVLVIGALAIVLIKFKDKIFKKRND